MMTEARKRMVDIAEQATNSTLILNTAVQALAANDPDVFIVLIDRFVKVEGINDDVAIAAWSRLHDAGAAP